MPIARIPTEEELRNHPAVSPEVWLAARRELLAAEKEVTRMNDQLSEMRRALPWVKVEKEYVFDTTGGKKPLAGLFGGRSQLIVYHFMFGPDWEEGCDGCSFLSDHFDGANLHLPHHDVTLLAVSRAPLAEIRKFKQRMGWRFEWVSSYDSDFNYDFHASTPPGVKKVLYNFEEIDAADAGEEHHGISVLYKSENGEIFHTYSAYARGVDILCGTHNLLDLTPKGRNERSTMDWVRLHDQYEQPEAGGESCCST
ncbi:MAG: thioredoxin family protein [Opitutales bacterium]|nr:thioredoxin family protein [Opitutales bacterium]